MSTWMIVRREGAWPTAGLGGRSAETDAWSDGGQCADHEADMLVQAHPQLLGVTVHVVTIHRAGEALVLELLFDGAGPEASDRAARPHEGAGSDKGGELVTGVQSPVELRNAREARVVGVGEDRVDDLR